MKVSVKLFFHLQFKYSIYFTFISSPMRVYITCSHNDQFPVGLTALSEEHCTGSRDGAVVRALASHQMWPGFDSQTWRHMWVEFVVGSRPCSERFFLSSPQKPTFPNSNSVWIIVKHFIMSLWLGRGNHFSCVHKCAGFSFIDVKIMLHCAST